MSETAEEPMDEESAEQDQLLEEAGDPATSPGRLAQLAQHMWARSRVAGNPNSPLALLLKLAEEYPAEVLANPALPFLLIERPDLPSRFPTQAMLAILRLEDAPLAFVKSFAASRAPEVARVAALHVRLAGELRDCDWAQHAERALGAEAASLDLRVCLLLVWRLLAGTPGALTLPSEELSKENVLHMLITAHASRFPAVADSRWTEALKRRVEENPILDRMTLDMLANTPDEQVRIAVVRHPLTPLATLNRLAFDPSPEVRKSVAQNRLMARDLSFRLAYAYLDDGTAHKPTTQRHAPEPGFYFTNCLASETLRPILALNPTLTATQLWRIADHLSERTHRDTITAQRLANHPQASEALLFRLADWPDPDVQLGVAYHPRTPVPLLQSLARHVESNTMRQALISTPKLPWDDAMKLIDGALPQAVSLALFSVLLHRPDATVEQCRLVARQALEQATLHSAEQRDGQSSALMLFVCASDYLEPAEYAPVLASTWWPLRLVVALNVCAPPEMLAALTHDGNVCVRAAARATLGRLASAQTGQKKEAV